MSSRQSRKSAASCANFQNHLVMMGDCPTRTPVKRHNLFVEKSWRMMEIHEAQRGGMMADNQL